MTPDDPTRQFRTLDEFTLGDLDAIWLMLRGDSVIDWTRLNLTTHVEVDEFLRVQGFLPDDESDLARIDAIRNEAIEYLRRNFRYPIPRVVAQLPVNDLMLQASGRGHRHRQMCACVILKVMHIIHHLQGRELLFMLPLSDAEAFHLVEEKVYRVIGGMLAAGLPIVEFVGGRKNRDSLYTKLLCKTETIASQIYDKLRFRIVTRSVKDILPVLNYLARRLFPFNYTIPEESKNTLLNLPALAQRHPRMNELLRLPYSNVRLGPEDHSEPELVDNRFSAKNYRVIHFVVDMPVRVPAEILANAPPAAWPLGPVIFVLTEFQIVDQETEAANEAGEASHARYKERQRDAVIDRLRLGGTKD